ncbi:MAG: hypothetical protein WAK71_00720 [Streptosporangiaceae bacterium]
MVTVMNEQPGASDRPDRQGNDQPNADGPGSGRSGSGRSGSERSGTARPRQGAPGTDLFGELQRWFIRQSAKNMRRELTGQVRRSLGGGRTEKTDVWDTVTHEIPPEVGESPECQWCPICRAARQMRDSGPGLGGQLTGAGTAVASAVQDAIGALDSLLSRGSGASPAGRGAPGAADRRAGTTGPAGTAGPANARVTSPAAGTDPGTGLPDDSGSWAAVVQEELDRPERDVSAGPGRQAPPAAGADPWSTATASGDADAEEESARPDGQGNGTDDRG